MTVRKKSAWKYWLGAAVAVLTVAALGMVILGTRYPGVTTSVSRYSERLNDWKSTGLVDHFPATVPAPAKHVRFSENPGFGQGNGWIQLRMALPPDEIGRIDDDVRTIARHEYSGGSLETAGSEASGAETLFYTSQQFPEEWNFPDHYAIYVIQSRGDMHRGASSGIAISITADEVVYWAEQR